MIPDKLILYHATAKGNIPSILKRGLIPKAKSCEQEIDRILAEYNLTRKDVPESIWKKPLERCEETTEKVYLSIDQNYAKGNCLAGLEMEYQLRAGILSLSGKDTSPEAVIGQIECELCEVEVPLEEMKDHTPEGWRASLRSHMRFYEIENPDWPKEKVEEEAKKGLLGEVTLAKVPPDWVKSCVNSFQGRMLYPFPKGGK